MILACATPPKVVVHPKETKRPQKLKKIWKIRKQVKKEEKNMLREFWELPRPIEYDLDFDDLFDTF